MGHTLSNKQWCGPGTRASPRARPRVQSLRLPKIQAKAQSTARTSGSLAYPHTILNVSLGFLLLQGNPLQSYVWDSRDIIWDVCAWHGGSILPDYDDHCHLVSICSELEAIANFLGALKLADLAVAALSELLHHSSPAMQGLSGAVPRCRPSGSTRPGGRRMSPHGWARGQKGFGAC